MLSKKKKNKQSFKVKKVLLFVFFITLVPLLGLFIFKSGLNIGPLEGSFLASVSLQSDLFAEPAKNIVGQSPEMIFVQKNSLKSVSPPASVDVQILGSILAGGEGLEEEKGFGRSEIVEHLVEQGEVLSSIAEKYDISLETILTANDLSSKSVIKPGQKLVILPIEGVVYEVRKGDTLGEIAEKYKSKTSEIISFNELTDEGDIFIGDILILPGGQKPKISSSSYIAIPIGSSYFICPHANCYISQGLHWYNAIDFAGKCGDPIHASAGGVVQRVSYGWNGGAGNTITILHPNGVVTGYGHISTSLVVSGQQVSQGEIVALMGGKPGTAGAGISTGCHVHFSVRGARNPFAK